MSKESKIKKRLEEQSKQTATPPNQKAPRQPLTAEQKARIIRNRLANRPVIVFRYPNGKLNTRFVVMLAVLLAALIAALYLISR